ncbi:type II toxin-antitoxin system VapC family toxin [Thermococcus sp. MAR1]|uniref:type II toxin-antitoxin system VapC family toxin n=1 Tax=Thermococcus sp. MAR1 TaxID=1638263 RepID=UPI00143A5D91|nr:type II toxin-antitoxin system VapC family toxin [Thermococcus sp. MAR1]
MMSLFLDSNLFIEHLKGNSDASALLSELMRRNFRLFTNETVYNEVLFVYLRTNVGGYWKLKKNIEEVKEAAKTFILQVLPLLSSTNFLDTTHEVSLLSLKFTAKYGLLPSDALILATAKYYGLDGIVSLDTDLLQIAPKEGLLAISKVGDLEGER